MSAYFAPRSLDGFLVDDRVTWTSRLGEIISERKFLLLLYTNILKIFSWNISLRCRRRRRRRHIEIRILLPKNLSPNCGIANYIFCSKKIEFILWCVPYRLFYAWSPERILLKIVYLLSLSKQSGMGYMV